MAQTVSRVAATVVNLKEVTLEGTRTSRPGLGV